MTDCNIGLVAIGHRAVRGALLVVLLPLAACSNLKISTDPDTEYARSGMYVGGGLSIVDERFAAFEDVPHDADELQPGLNLRAGYRFHPRFAAELVLQTYSSFAVELANAQDGDVEGRAVSGSIKGFVSTSSFQPYGFVGLGLAETDNSTGVGTVGSSSVVAGGVGADYYFNRNLALFIEAAYYHPTGDSGEFDFVPLTAGVNYRL
jgi:opacity protein-like surface antigen